MLRLLEQPADPKPSKGELLRKQLFNLTEDTFEKHKAKVVSISGFKGVHLDDKKQRWRARGLNGKKGLGTFASKESAARARDRHVLSYKTNHKICDIAAELNFHPRNYLTPDGELLPLSEVVGLSEES